MVDPVLAENFTIELTFNGSKRMLHVKYSLLNYSKGQFLTSIIEYPGDVRSILGSILD